MGKNIWTVSPASRTIDGLKYTDADGVEHPFWIKVKQRLTVGEQKRVQTAGFGGMRNQGTAEAEINVDWTNMAFARAATYLVAWSLEKDAETHEALPLDRATIEALEPDVFDIVDRAIAEHVEAMDAAKKSRAGASTSDSSAG